MPGEMAFGDVPTWLAAASPVVVSVLEGRRRNRVAALGRKVEDLVATTQNLAERVLAAEELEELVNRAIEQAARTTWQQKLDALANVVATAVDGNDEISSSLLVEAALSRLERPHALALSHISSAGTLTRHQLVERMPEATALVDPLVAVLAGEGLIRNVAATTYDGIDGQEKWVLSELGEELLLLLDPDHSCGAALGEVEVHVANHSVTVTKGRSRHPTRRGHDRGR